MRVAAIAVGFVGVLVLCEAAGAQGADEMEASRRCTSEDEEIFSIMRRHQSTTCTAPECPAAIQKRNNCLRVANADIKKREQKIVDERLEQYRAGKATRQQADLDAENERAASDEAVRRDPKAMAVVFGAIFCHTKQARVSALNEIAQEKKYARIGGMVNKAKLYALQQVVRWADETDTQEGIDLKSFKGVKPASCASAGVRDVLRCLGEGEQCAGDEQRHLASFVPEYTAPDDDE